ncbi:BTAD domain-containing putative transcriptional regulator [Micromonospora sp. NPDC049836]|uniref:AfsR/SARP family transcriptional regulator n=1 Tax=Micromonospora sp. NPDC049836 TaxID=3364274 RepID=UPI003789FC5B
MAGTGSAFERSGGGSGLTFEVLGRPRVCRDGAALELGTPKQRVVLAALLLNPHRPLSTAQLVESIWWHPPSAAVPNVRLYLAGLRRALHLPGESESRLRTERAGGYRLRIEPGELDVHRLATLTDAGDQALRDGRLPVAAEQLGRALRLWRGRTLDGMTYGPAIEANVRALDEARLRVAEKWARIQLDLGRPEETVPELRALVAENPVRERLWMRLITALHQAGEPGAALAAYAELRKVLATELGVEPAPDLRVLHQRILRSEAQGHTGYDERPLRATPAGGARGRAPAVSRPRQLPGARGELHGRDRELAQLRRLLAEVVDRGPVVVTIDGVAGVGKSALAVAAAAAAPGFPDGQLYVDLQGATPGLEPLRPVDVLGRFLRALGVPAARVPDEEAEAAALFRSTVARRRVVVVLDNAVSPAQVRSLLPGGRGCAAVVTSRRGLPEMAVADRIRLATLPPDASVAVLRQFAGPDRVAADADAARRLAELCGHLPLALQVAGARLAARPDWPVAHLADRLAAARRRLDELAVGDIAVRSSIELTYKSLDPTGLRAFRRLGLLPARDFSAWALAALLGVPLTEGERVLEALVTARLVEPVAAPGPGGLPGTYRMHDLIRLFAADQVAVTDQPRVRAAAVRRLVGTAVALTEQADTRLGADFLGSPQRRVARWSLPQADLRRLTDEPAPWFEREHRFLAAVVDSALAAGATALAGELAAAMTALLQVGGHFELWRQVQQRALSAANRADDRRTAARLHRGLGELDTIQDRYAEAVAHFRAARLVCGGAAAAPETAHDAAVAAGLGYLHRLRGQYASARREFVRARELAEAAGNEHGSVYATSGIGVVNLEQGRLAEATDCFNECLRVSRRIEYLPGVAQALRSLGQVQRAGHRYHAAAVYFGHALAISERLGDRASAAHAACWLGEARFRQGRHHESRWILARCLHRHRQFANRWGEAATLRTLAEAQLAVGRPRAAAGRATAAVRIWRDIGSPYWLAHGLETLGDALDALGRRDVADRQRAEAARLREGLRDG